MHEPNDLIARLIRFQRSRAFGWLGFCIALFGLLTTPVATYRLWQTGLRGWPLVGTLVIALPFRFLWIGLFFNVWLRNTGRRPRP